MGIELYISYSFLIIFGLFSWWYIRKANKHPEAINIFRLKSIPGVFTTLGVLGTFLGISVGLYNFEVDNMETSIKDLLEGMKMAFGTSILGISLSLVSGYFIRQTLHKNGEIIPVPKSEEAKLLEQLLKEIKTNREEIVASNTTTTSDLLIEIKKTNTELITLGKKTSENSDEMVETLNENHALMENKFDEFAKLLAKSNTEALRIAMEKLITDFNDTFKNLITSLVDQNFKELNNSVQSLNDWQKQNRTDVENLYSKLNNVIEQLNALSGLMQETYENSSSQLANASSSLANITTNTDKLLDQDSELVTIVNALKKVLVEEGALTKSFDKATNSMDKLLAATEEFEITKRKITEWLNREKGIHTAMQLFNQGIVQLKEQLNELEGIKTEELKILDNSFDKRIGRALDSTFAELDKLIREYIKFMEKNRSIEIKVKEVSNGQV